MIPVQDRIKTLLLVAALCLGGEARAEGPEAPDAARSRAIFLLLHLADQARLTEDPAFAARTQLQVAGLLWAYDRERSRSIYRRIFDSVNPLEQGADDAGPPVERWRLASALLNELVIRDPDLAEELLRALNDDPRRSPADPDAALMLSDLIASVAMRLAERDPARGVELGRLSLACGADSGPVIVSGHFGRLLTTIAATDPVLAWSLFALAVDCLDREASPGLDGVHALSSFLASSGEGTRSQIPRAVLLRFLELALNRLAQSAAEQNLAGSDPERGAAAYFTARQIGALVERYLPERLAALKTTMLVASDPGLESMLDPQRFDVAHAETAQSGNALERNSTLARAALAWLAKGDVIEAQAAAARISDASMRDRVLSRIARARTSEGLIDDAVAVANFIADDGARVGVLLRLAAVSTAASDYARAGELLNEAETEASKLPRTDSRVNALLAIAAGFASFDTVRAFEVMRAAVSAINRRADHEGAATSPSAERRGAVAPVADLTRLNFTGTLGVLAQSDFEGALLLAKQIKNREVSLVAQVAVCRGALALPQARVETTGRVYDSSEGGEALRIAPAAVESRGPASQIDHF